MIFTLHESILCFLCVIDLSRSRVASLSGPNFLLVFVSSSVLHKDYVNKIPVDNCVIARLNFSGEGFISCLEVMIESRFHKR